MNKIENEGMEKNTKDNNQHKSENTTPHAKPAGTSKSDFKKELNDFFAEHNPKKLKFTTKITDKFKGKEDIVMAHLRANYSHGQAPKRKRGVPASAKKDTSTNVKATNAKAKKADKSKSIKKFIIIGIVAVVIIALCVVGYLFKDKFLNTSGKTTEHPKQEQSIQKAKVVETPVETEKQEINNAEPANDSTKKDTTKTILDSGDSLAKDSVTN